MVHDKPSGTLIPGVGSLYYPTLGEHHEAFGICPRHKQVALLGVSPTADIAIGGVANHAHLHAVALHKCLRTLPRVAAIHNSTKPRQLPDGLHPCPERWRRSH